MLLVTGMSHISFKHSEQKIPSNSSQTLLDFIFAGSVTSAAVPGIQNLRHVFLIISILSLAWGIWREGLSRRMVRRAVISGGMVAWGQYSKRVEVAGGHHDGHHSCH